MIRRTMDATLLNEVANRPDVRPWLGGDGPLDLTPIVENPSNICLVSEHGGWVGQPILPGIYELHTIFAPEGRGRRFFAAGKEAIRYVFARTDALEIVTKCPDDNAGARMAASLMGFRERFRREGAWSPGVGISYRVFSLDDWFIRDAECLRAGRAFHDMVAKARADGGYVIPEHPEDETHDRAAGAAALMIQGGNMLKSLGFYNRWATFAGYGTIAATSNDTIDMSEGLLKFVVQIVDGAAEVLLCRLEQSSPPAPPPLASERPS